MITIITGAPGTGKTAALVSLLQGTLLQSGRQIYVHGIPELLIPHVPLVDPDKWFEDVPDGSIIIIDEVQTVWRPRGPGQKVPEHISKLETHRHRGLDFYIITQGPNLVDSNVRALCGRHIHLRDLGFTGRWWYEWPETADQCRTVWKNAPIKKKYTLPKKVFEQYKSSTQHNKPIRSFPKIVIFLALALLLLGYLGFKAYGSISAKIGPAPSVAAVSGVPGLPGASSPAIGRVVQSVDEAVDFKPRVPGRPWTAPAYDALRVVVKLPTITGAICLGTACKCYHNNAFLPGVSNAACNAWAAEPSFNPYQLDEVVPSPQNLADPSPVVAMNK